MPVGLLFMVPLFVFVGSWLPCLFLSVHGSPVCLPQFMAHQFVLRSSFITCFCQFMAHLFVFVSSWLTCLFLSVHGSPVCFCQFTCLFLSVHGSPVCFCQFMAHLFVFVSSWSTCLLLSVHGSSVCFCQFSPHLFVLISLWLTSCCYIKVLLTNIGFDHFVITVHDSPTLFSFMNMRFGNFSFNPLAEQLLLY